MMRTGKMGRSGEVDGKMIFRTQGRSEQRFDEGKNDRVDTKEERMTDLRNGWSMKQNVKGKRTCNRILHCSKYCSSCIPSCIILIAATENRAQVSSSLRQGMKPHLHPHACVCKIRLYSIFWPSVNVICLCTFTIKSLVHRLIYPLHHIIHQQ